jgi:hypothetical protein
VSLGEVDAMVVMIVHHYLLKACGEASFLNRLFAALRVSSQTPT